MTLSSTRIVIVVGEREHLAAEVVRVDAPGVVSLIRRPHPRWCLRRRHRAVTSGDREGSDLLV